MYNFNKKYIISFAILFLVASALGFTSPASAGDVAIPNPLCPAMANPCVSSPTCVCNFGDLIARITIFISEVIAALAVLMLVVAGIFFVLAGANPENVNKAKHIALYAIIGLAIALAATGLVRVIQAVINAPATS